MLQLSDVLAVSRRGRRLGGAMRTVASYLATSSTKQSNFEALRWAQLDMKLAEVALVAEQLRLAKEVGRGGGEGACWV